MRYREVRGGPGAIKRTYQTCAPTAAGERARRRLTEDGKPEAVELGPPAPPPRGDRRRPCAGSTRTPLPETTGGSVPPLLHRVDQL